MGGGVNCISSSELSTSVCSFIDMVGTYETKSAFLSNQSFVNVVCHLLNVVCRLLNAAKVETNTSFNHRVY
jgi:hypothetical protein